MEHKYGYGDKVVVPDQSRHGRVLGWTMSGEYVRVEFETLFGRYVRRYSPEELELLCDDIDPNEVL